jgi:hypothetical protein
MGADVIELYTLIGAKLLHFSASSYSIPAPSYSIFRHELYKIGQNQLIRLAPGLEIFCYSILPRIYLFVALSPKIVIIIFRPKS